MPLATAVQGSLLGLALLALALTLKRVTSTGSAVFLAAPEDRREGEPTVGDYRFGGEEACSESEQVLAVTWRRKVEVSGSGMGVMP